jgi:hypothetical protein
MDAPKPGPHTPAPPSKTTITAEVELITPDMAREYLNKMAKNRKLRESTVNAYATDMEAGLWKENGESIIFNNLGELTDGQHRLASIVKSDTEQRLLVVRGVDPEVMPTIDVGRRRTVGDMLNIEGYANAALAASIGRLVLIYDLENFTAAAINSVSSPQVYLYVDNHTEDVARAAHRCTQLAAHVPAMQSVLGAAYYIFWRVDPEACEQFFNAMINMRTDGEGDPRLALMRRLTTIRTDRTRVNQMYTLDLFLRAWNAWREQKSLAMIPLAKTLQWRKVL